LTSSQFTNLHALSLSHVDTKTNQDAQVDADIPKNDWATIAPVLDFLPTALLCACTVSVSTLVTLLLLSCNRGVSVAISTGTGALTLFGLCSYKSAQAKAQIDEIKSQPEEWIERQHSLHN
jgi:hypothetical protein